ncbi:MAG: exosortase X [Bacteroidia bacterium]
MNIAFLKNPVARFLLIIFSLYISWYLVYDLWLHPDERFDLFIVDLTLSMAKWILEAMGYLVFTGADRLIGIDGASGLWMGDNCNGITLFALFTCFIIAYKGRIRYKLFFIPAGIILIHLLNVLRVVILAILDTHSRAWTEFNHAYTFNIVILGFIFWLWMIWVNRFADRT